MSATISDAAITLIKTFEGDPPPRRPEWPGGDSGITLGYGCDIGADPDSLSAWKAYLSASDMARLQKTKGLQGGKAQAALPQVANIEIPQAASSAVFNDFTLPGEIRKTLKAFPGSEQLPPDSLGALVSVVYNRGTAMNGDRRTEMRATRDAIAAGRGQWYQAVVEIAAMTRLWPGTPTASNLSGRRLAEAALFARGLRDAGLLPGALIKGDSGDPVKDLQAALGITADGLFGTDTMVSVWRAQPTVDQPATGVADADTQRALEE